MRKMEEYYKVLHFLKYDDVDRLYPCEEYFIDYDTDGNEINVPYNDDNLIFQPNKDTFSGVDYIEVLLESSEKFNYGELKFSFSEFVKGYAPVMELDCVNEGAVQPNTVVKAVFHINPIDNSMSIPSRNLTGVRSLVLTTPNDSLFTIHDIIFRKDNATYTLELLDRFIENGKYYITSRLHTDYKTLPEELEDHVYTAAAGYAWSSVWEYEARIMNDEQKNAKSYGKWLFAEVDDAIANWKETMQIDEDVVYVQDTLTSSLPLRW